MDQGNAVGAATTGSREIAAQCWCDPETSRLVMIPELAEAFAKRLDMQKAEIERLRLILRERDQFIVAKGLWVEFVGQLSEEPKPATPVVREKLARVICSTIEHDGEPWPIHYEAADAVLALLSKLRAGG